MIASHLNCKMCIRVGESNDWKLLCAADHGLAWIGLSYQDAVAEEAAARERGGGEVGRGGGR